MKTILNKEDILNFWFLECTPAQWFKKNPDFDSNLATRFLSTVENGLSRKLESWADSKSGYLSLILVLDQFTRNIFRNTPRAFSGDTMALSLSFQCHEREFLLNQNIHWSHFMLLPMMHSEDISIQESSLPLFRKFTTQKAYEFALRHRDIVARFGRFPHRNSILGRTSTDKELKFLLQPRSSF